MKRISLLLALMALAVACSEPVAVPARARHTFVAKSAGDTVYAAALVIRHPNGDVLRFTSHGTYVRISAFVDGGTASHLQFGSDGWVTVNSPSLRFDANDFAVLGSTPVVKKVVTGDRSAGTALADLLSDLEVYGLVIDSTVP